MLTSKLGDIQEMIDDSSREVRAQLEETAADLDNVRENEIRKISHGLHSSILSDGLVPGLRSLRDQFERSVPITLEISQEIVDRDSAESGALSSDVRLAVYRVAHEALGNVIKHAGATHVLVQVGFDVDAREITLLVQDDGRGFKLEAARRGLGMQTMKDYLEPLGGSHQIDTAPDKGTTVAARVPLDSAPVTPGQV